MKDEEEGWEQEVAAELEDALDSGGADMGIEPPGWLTPEGEFFASERTPAARIVGLELGGHEAAAIGWLPENRPDLFGRLEDERIARGYETYLDSDGTDMIKRFMFANGFVRLGPADGEMEIEGNPNPVQERLIRTAAEALGVRFSL